MSSPTLYALDAASIIKPYKIICEPQRSFLCCIYQYHLGKWDKLDLNLIRTSLINLSSIMIQVQICHSERFMFFLKNALTFLTSGLATIGSLEWTDQR